MSSSALVEVRYPASSRPGIGGAQGLDPVAISTLSASRAWPSTTTPPSVKDAWRRSVIEAVSVDEIEVLLLPKHIDELPLRLDELCEIDVAGISVEARIAVPRGLAADLGGP